MSPPSVWIDFASGINQSSPSRETRQCFCSTLADSSRAPDGGRKRRNWRRLLRIEYRMRTISSPAGRTVATISARSAMVSLMGKGRVPTVSNRAVTRGAVRRYRNAGFPVLSPATCCGSSSDEAGTSPFTSASRISPPASLTISNQPAELMRPPSTPSSGQVKSCDWARGT